MKGLNDSVIVQNMEQVNKCKRWKTQNVRTNPPDPDQHHHYELQCYYDYFDYCPICLFLLTQHRSNLSSRPSVSFEFCCPLKCLT